MGDIMRSITLLKYDHINKSIIEIARDYNSNYMKSIEYMNGIHENYYLGGDMLGNIFTCKYQNDIINDDDDRNHLEICGEYHCDDIINCMIQGTLIGQPIDNHHHQHHHSSSSSSSSSSSNNENNSTQQQQQHHINDYQRQSGMSIFHSNYLSITGLPLDTTSPSSSSSSSSSSILLGGINGSISTILSLDEDSYTFFLILEKFIKQNIIISNGTLNHNNYRSFHNDLKINESKNVLDGDLIEIILSLSLNNNNNNYLTKSQLDMITECINNELNLIYATKQQSHIITATTTNNITDDIDINNTLPANNQSVPCCSNNTTTTATNNNTENVGTLIMNLSNSSRKFNFSTEEIIRRVEDIARLH